MNNLPDLSVLDNLSPEERKLALEILKEYSQDGQSAILDDLKYSDFEEIPVDVDTFLDDPHYLGQGLWITDDYTGERRCTVFPYWREVLKKIFPDNTTTAVNTVVLAGAIGIGKTFAGVLIQLYLLYRMLCLKDPYTTWGMQPIDKITFSMMNITIEAAEGVGWSKLQELIQSSPWFMEHGNMNASRTNPTWQPPKGVELVFGSSNRTVVGRALFCLDGDTEIYTSAGCSKLKHLINKQTEVLSVDPEGKLIASDKCTVVPTAIATEEYQITLEDGTLIKCTQEHRLMLKDGSYKAVKDLTLEDELADAPTIDSTELTYCVYMHTNLRNFKRYIGITCNSPARRWQNGFGYKNNPYFYAAIQKDGWSGFRHEIITENLDQETAYKKEQELITFYDTTNPEFGYNCVYGGGGTPKYRTEEEKTAALRAQNHASYLRKKASKERYAKHLESSKESHKRRYQNPENRQKRLSAVAQIRQETKALRKQIRQLHKTNPDILSEADVFTALGYKENGSYICSSKQKLQEILDKLMEVAV